MKGLFLLFNLMPIIKNIIKTTVNIPLPEWHKPSINCVNDRDCPIPYACCHDAFFPIEKKFCCIGYKKRTYEFAYIFNYVINNPEKK